MPPVSLPSKENLNTGSAGYHYGDSYGTDNNADGQNSSSNKASCAKAAEISDTENSVTELSTDTITAVSGKRILLMIQQNGSARFEKQGISVSDISADFASEALLLLLFCPSVLLSVP